jgi:ribosomal protein L37AE/L43A
MSKVIIIEDEKASQETQQANKCPECDEKLEWRMRTGHTDIFTGPKTVRMLCCSGCEKEFPKGFWHPAGKPFL